MENKERLVYTIPQVAELLGLSQSYVYQLVKEDVIPSIKLGRRRVISKEKFHKWLEES